MTDAPAPPSPPRGRLWPPLLLLLTLAIAAAARVAMILASGPGLHVDEASNVWNALCLARAGVDEHRVAWPLLYTGAFGDNRSPLFLYAIVPFQWLFGPAPTIARWPAAFAGVAAVLALFLVARRLFDARVALVAAASLALSPWQLFASSWGHESTLCPALVLAGVALLLASGAPLCDRPARPRARLALLAGIMLGVACFGYAALRIYLPIFLVAAALAAGRDVLAAWRDPARRSVLVAFACGFALLFVPLAYVHLIDPAINARASLSWAWEAEDAWPTRVARVLARYPAHFGPRLLAFDTGNDPAQSLPRGFGVLQAVAIPFFLIGAAQLVLAARRSTSARVLLAALLTYPAGDLLNAHDGPNLLRSSPGLAWLDVIVGVGAVAAFNALPATRRRAFAVATVVVSLLGAGAFVARTHAAFALDVRRWSVRTMDLRGACAWLAPRLDSLDAVLWTQRDTSFAYAPVLTYLGDTPARWFAEPLERTFSAGERFRGADLVLRTGKHHFIFEPAARGDIERALTAGGRAARVVHVVRTGELAVGRAPDAVVLAPDGRPSLELYEVSIPAGP